MRDSHHTVGCDDASLHDVHVLPTNGVIQSEHLSIRRWDFHLRQLGHGASPLVRNVVDDQQAARICHLPMVSVVSLNHQTQLDVSLKDTGNRMTCLFEASWQTQLEL